MSRTTQKQRDEEASQAPPGSTAIGKAEPAAGAPREASETEHADGKATKDIPRWRQIEIMQERAQLREALGDFDAEFDELEELEMEVFGSETENETLYQHNDAEIEEDVDLDDEVLDDDDFDDFDED